MKSLVINKLSIILLCLGGTLLLSPQSRAQSEIAPDRFDGTDSWALAAAAKVPLAQAKSHPASASLQAQNTKPASPVLQTIAARETVAPGRSSAIINKKRKPTAKSN